MSHTIISQNGTTLITQNGNQLSPEVGHISHILLQDGVNSILLQTGLFNVSLQSDTILTAEPRIRHGGITRTLL